MEKDKVTISITLEREMNGTITRKTHLSGEGFHYFELIGMLQITCYDFAQQSIATAKDLTKDKPVHLVFDSTKE